MVRVMTGLFGTAALLVALVPAQAADLKLERAVLLMRHGVRPPTKAQPMPPGYAADPWPSWPVKPGYLTPHGARAIALLGKADRVWFAQAGLLSRSGCPAGVVVRSDSDQRTIATGDSYLVGLAPHCRIPNRHEPQDAEDPLFQGAGNNGAPFDPDRANRAVADALGPGGIAGAEVNQRGALARLDWILCGARTEGCGVSHEPSAIIPARPGAKPKLSGALDRGSTAAQILLLEYAEGKPMAEVGWGRATSADIGKLSALHSAEFAILARPHYLAAANIAPIARAIDGALRGGAKLTVFVGHDTNVASLGGLLDLHWQAPGFAADDPAPGGAIELDLLRDAKGRRFVRAFYRSQSLDQIRSLSTVAPGRAPLTIGPCGPLCPIDRFLRLLAPIR